MNNNEIRQYFLDYYQRNDHKILPSSAIIPSNDSTLLFTSAGMVQFKDIFVNQTICPEHPRVVTSQKCLRAGGKRNDLENVGYTTCHNTFFEMLGNFSFGDYFKERAIELAWNLITKDFGLSKDKLIVTVYYNDVESANYWRKIAGLKDQHIIRIKNNDNFWQMGSTGPCGPCSEIFYDHGTNLAGSFPGTLGNNSPRFMEIWNLVFMQFEQLANGEFIALPKPSIDTGMGLERISAVLQGVHNIYDTDSLRNLIEAVGHILNTDPLGDKAASHRIIVDHLRACSFMIADGVIPSNEGRGYVLRRILRRALRHAHVLGARTPVIHYLLPTLINEMGEHFQELIRAEALISKTIHLESVRFIDMLDRGLKLLNHEIAHMTSGDYLDGNIAFKLYDTFGFPIDLTADILKNLNISIDMDTFNSSMLTQRQRARATWSGINDTKNNLLQWKTIANVTSTKFLGFGLNTCKAKIQTIIINNTTVKEITAPIKALIITNQTPFYAESGGQQGDQGQIITNHAVAIVEDTQKKQGIFGHHINLINGTLRIDDHIHMFIDKERRMQLARHHSATHLLHRALKIILGNHVMQKGSLISNQSLRFDFTHHQAVNADQKKSIESIINQEVFANTVVNTKIMSFNAAISEGATALFDNKYAHDEVRVVSMGQKFDDTIFSLELCGGTHVKRTGDIGVVLLQSERGIASGIRRIEAVVGSAVIEAYQKINHRLEALASKLKVPSTDLEVRVKTLMIANQKLKKRLSQQVLQLNQVKNIVVNNITLYYEYRDNVSSKDLKFLAKEWRKHHNSGIYLVIINEDNKISLAVASQQKNVNSVLLLRTAIEALGNKTKGGGNIYFAQGSGGSITDQYSITRTIHAVTDSLRELNF